MHTHRIYLLQFIVLSIGAMPVCANAAGPSFDCKKASKDDEKAICGSAELSALDLRLAEQFKYALGFGNEQGVREIGRSILHKRRNCESNEQCIKEVILRGIKSYNDDQTPIDMATPSQPSPPNNEQAANEQAAEEVPVPSQYYTCQITSSHRESHSQFLETDDINEGGELSFDVDFSNRTLNNYPAQFSPSSVYATSGRPFVQYDGTVAPTVRTFLLDTSNRTFETEYYTRQATHTHSGTCTLDNN
jgi:uncharacterized protein